LISVILFEGLQRMKSDSTEVRALVQALAMKINLLPVEMDSKGIGSALYGMKNYIIFRF
jgi:hypothetical protein